MSCELGWVVEESEGLREKSVQVSGGLGRDVAEPAARWSFSEEAESWVSWVHYYPTGLLFGCGIL